MQRKSKTFLSYQILISVTSKNNFLKVDMAVEGKIYGMAPTTRAKDFIPRHRRATCATNY